MESKLRIQNLTWQPNAKQSPVLENLSSQFCEGGFYGILGPNGSGKTSLLRHILRFLQGNEGEITLKEKKLSGYTHRELATNLAFVPQNTFLDAEFTVEDIVAMGRMPYQKRFSSLSKKDKEIIEHAMEITNCIQYKKKNFTYLSGGEAQRVLVARAIAQDTPWILLDEPISHLDIKHQVEVMETLKELNEKENKTIIAILHDLNLTVAYCKEVILMKNGQIYAAGSVERILTSETLRQVYEMNFDKCYNPVTKAPYFVPNLSK